MNHEFFTNPLTATDPLVANALAGEQDRQQHCIELIASENIVSQAVLDALGHPITNKTLEGYPGKRFHGGGQFVDIIETAAIDRCKALFQCAYANVQPHSGTQANQAVLMATVKPGDVILSLNLAAGGHLSHGAKANLSGRWFDAHHYSVDANTGRIDYDAVAAQAKTVQPKLLITGGSAYPRTIDFARLAAIAKANGALLLVDMAHIAGLVAAGVHPSPIPHADFVTATTTKTLRGPRGGLIMTRDEQWAKSLQSAIFPGVQGSLHTPILAAKAVCLWEASQPEFKDYGQKVVDNAKALAKGLTQRGIALVSGGTDTHLVLLDFRARSAQGRAVLGQAVEDVLALAGITSNKNPVPFDVAQPARWSGLRLGVAAATTRGLGLAQFDTLAAIIACLVDRLPNVSDAVLANAKDQVAALCQQFPIYGATHDRPLESPALKP